MDTKISRSPADTFVFDHPTLGSMTGLISPETPDVVRFRAIPYATLPGRFKQSIMRENLDGLSRDFTKPGYACPHNFDMDDIHSGGPYPGQELIETSEFDSLILEINVPRSYLDELKNASAKKLPVMTYIHGGGFVLGKIDAQHNTAPMVQHSIAISKPILTTAIQYRLGALGFLATPDGGKNFAFWDQRNALLWIQTFIGGFGGDKSLVTLFGESAGGYSICCHMLSHPPADSPLFSRVIIMSGVMGPMMTPVSEDDAVKTFEKICEDLDIQERGTAALEKLRALDVKTLVAASESYTAQGNMWPPVDDASFFRTKVTWDTVFEQLANCEWVNDMIVGNTGFEGLAYASVANMLTPTTWLAHLKVNLSDEAARKVMDAYNVTVGMDQNRFLTAAMRWCGDVIFDAPIYAFTNHITSKTTKNIYRYVFDMPNPFPNAPFYQQAHHWVDVYFLFRTMQFRYPHAYLRDASDKHAELWIAFANGKAPWSAATDGVVMVADEREGWVEKTMREYEEMSRVRWDRLNELWDAWGEKAGERWVPLNLVKVKS